MTELFRQDKKGSAMPVLPQEIISVLSLFSSAFATRISYQTAIRLIIGTLLAVGWRTAASALRAVGPAHDRQFVNDHRRNAAGDGPRAT